VRSSAPTITRAPPSPSRTPSSTARARRAISTRNAKGARLSGSQRYTLTFDEPPPVKGFWSITLYDQHHFFAPNALERFSLGTKSKELRFESDGSFVIYVQSDRPSEERLANWLPSPQGPFSLYLRAYWPLPAIQEGRWTPPPVVRA